MPGQLLEYVPILIGVVVAVGVAGGMLVLNALLGPRFRSAVKTAPFECGNASEGSTRNRFNVKYYLVALFFLVFDVEAVFLLPWAVEYRRLLSDPGLGILALVEVLIFAGVLVLGLLYVWKRKALDWE